MIPPTRVYILGAGFSHGYNQNSYPLMGDFLQAAKKGKTYQLTGAHELLARFIAKYFGYAEYHDIEKVMSFLSVPVLDDPAIPSENRSKLYDDLVGLIQSTLGACNVNPLLAKHSVYAAFANHLVETDSTIISFNYDLLLDTLLYQTGKWLGSDGYGAEIPSVEAAFPYPLRPSKASPLNRSRSGACLLKLHGSINWGIPTLHKDYDETVYQDSSGYYPVGSPGVVGTGPQPMAGSSIASWKPPLTIRCKPFIVPPLLDKTVLLKHKTLRVIWNIARESLENADELVFIGYSLPVTDFSVEFLFRQAVKERTEKVTVVAPGATARLYAKYADIFKDKVTPMDKDAHAWFVESGVIDVNKLGGTAN